jgi:hypothetical protein
MRFAALAVVALVSCAEPEAAASGKEEVLAVIDRCFEGMRLHDSAVLEEVMRTDAVITRLRTRDDGTVDAFTTTGGQFIAELGNPGPAYVERIWDPEVLMGAHLATVRAPYDFYVDTTFSHCGMDHFTLVRETTRWRIQSIAYTFSASTETECATQFTTP